MDRGCFLSGESTLTLPLCMKRTARWDHSTTPAPLDIAGRGRIQRRGVIYDGLICYFSLSDDTLRTSINAAIAASGVPCWPTPSWLASVGDRRPLLERARAAGLFAHRIDIVDSSHLADDYASFDGPCVVKVGNQHAGGGKNLVRTRDDATALANVIGSEFATIEPFFDGESIRLFVAGTEPHEEVVCVRYDNAESWIKNAAGCEVSRDTAPTHAIEHALSVHRLFQSAGEGTQLSGVDYIRDRAGAWHYLEWNGFPWLAADPDVARLGTAILESAMKRIEQAPRPT
jgi:ribosomal protein S6--L-glutamate ligase